MFKNLLSLTLVISGLTGAAMAEPHADLRASTLFECPFSGMQEVMPSASDEMENLSKSIIDSPTLKRANLAKSQTFHKSADTAAHLFNQDKVPSSTQTLAKSGWCHSIGSFIVNTTSAFIQMTAQGFHLIFG